MAYLTMRLLFSSDTHCSSGSALCHHQLLFPSDNEMTLGRFLPDIGVGRDMGMWWRWGWWWVVAWVGGGLRWGQNECVGGGHGLCVDGVAGGEGWGGDGG